MLTDWQSQNSLSLQLQSPNIFMVDSTVFILGLESRWQSLLEIEPNNKASTIAAAIVEALLSDLNEVALLTDRLFS